MKINDEDPNGQSCPSKAFNCTTNYIWGIIIIILIVIFIALKI